MNPQLNRRRLTVSRCDPVTNSGGGAGQSQEDIARRLKDAGLDEVFSKAGAKKAVSITSTKDPNRKAFSDKDEAVLSNTSCSEAELRSWMKERGVSWTCKKGKKPESPNQDSFSVLVVEDQFAIYGVFDGHGPEGHGVSDLAREVLLKHFLQHADRNDNPEKAMRECFVSTQQFLTDVEDLDCSSSGSTCTFAYHRFDTQTITIAHVGDSRGVLIKKRSATDAPVAEELTTDHKPNLPEERRRIENANPPGRVVFDGYYNHRVFTLTDLFPGLNMSRALGDTIAHSQAGLTAMPDTRTIDLKMEHAAGFNELYLLICTDGVWEFIENDEAAKLAFQTGYNGASGVEYLATMSWDRWMQDSGNEISDDITGVMIRL